MDMRFVGEFIGTMLLIVFGTGLLAGLNLNKSLSKGANWLIVCFGWGFSVMIGVFASGLFDSGGHLNPAVTIAFALGGMFDWADVVPYIIAQVAGAFVGATFTVIHYYPHFKATPKAEVHTLGIFSTGPAIDHKIWNLVSEISGTFFFIFSLLFITGGNIADGLAPLLVGFLIVVIGFSFGPTTGFAINPARDLGPRLAYALLPIPNKGDANWQYQWVTIVGPIMGAVLAVAAFNAIT